MIRRFIAPFAAALALGATLLVPMANAKTCHGRYVHAVIGGAQKCLGAGEYCARRYERQYERHGFSCEWVGGTRRLEHD
jgi:hypothetical protein